MSTGTISRLVRDRGFGFIKAADGSEDIFFHSSSVNETTFDELSEGQEVEFDTEPDPKQPNRSRATSVRISS